MASAAVAEEVEGAEAEVPEEGEAEAPVLVPAEPSGKRGHPKFACFICTNTWS